ncbi:hypothetical protein AJ79_02185 [Helicocarpus griseus UAMH5409]|uniref:Pentatricopeptide repeat protein n=1 Tax=Helicocarpus griseus UAMH5409 TaxID=1447875 RepID=A0A2B7XVL1_9EURO|nr:hypothetical protein AJ79_02185 [Helicocarpus griseus UAMH5409]
MLFTGEVQPHVTHAHQPRSPSATADCQSDLEFYLGSNIVDIRKPATPPIQPPSSPIDTTKQLASHVSGVNCLILPVHSLCLRSCMLVRPCSVYHCEHRCSLASQCLTIRRPAIRRESLSPGYPTSLYHSRSGGQLENIKGPDVTPSGSAKRCRFLHPSLYQLPLRKLGTPAGYSSSVLANRPTRRFLSRDGSIFAYSYTSTIRTRSYTSGTAISPEDHQLHPANRDNQEVQDTVPLDKGHGADANIPAVPAVGKRIKSQSNNRKARLVHIQRRYRTINRTIASVCRFRRRRLSHEEYKWEYALAFKSLYTKTSIHPDWANNFRVAIQHRLKGVDSATVWDKLKLDHEEEALKWLASIDWTADPTNLSRRWRGLRRSEAERLWPVIALWLLLNHPRAAVAFLIATDILPRPPFHMVSDCFIYLEALHYNDIAYDKQSKEYYHKAIHSCLGPAKWSAVQARQRGIRLFTKRGTSKDWHTAFSFINSRNIAVGWQTAVYFMDFFTKEGDISRALEALRLIPASAHPWYLKKERVLERCCKLLTLDYVIEKDGQRYFRILPEILKIGVRPNQSMLNIMFRNALKQRVPAVMPDIINEMGRRRLRPDSYAYISFLDDAVRRGDLQHLDVIVREISDQEHLMTNPFIASKMLHVMYLLDSINPQQGWGDADVFARMLKIYSTAHDTQPLVDLGIVQDGQATLHRESKKSSPSSHALVIMIAAFLRMGSTQVMRDTFKRFINLCNEGHESFGPLAESDYIYNMFMNLFSQRQSDRLDNCIMVLNTMFQPLLPTAVLRSQNDRHLKQIKPTVQTWTIFLSAFVRERQYDAIEKIRTMMLKQGLQFNDFTWNIAVRGYSSVQLLDKAAAAVKMMMSEGWEPDKYTMRSLERIRGHDRLFTLLDIVDSKIPSRGLDKKDDGSAETRGDNKPVGGSGDWEAGNRYMS